MKKNIITKIICSFIVSAIVASSGIVMPFTPEEPIDPPYVVSPDDEFLPEKGAR